MGTYKDYPLTIKSKKADSGTIVISTVDVDRDGDRVLAGSILTDNYMRNPVVLYGHDYRAPEAVIGATTSLRQRGNGLEASFKLRPAANEHDPQNVVRLLWGGGWVNAASIGFRPLEWQENDTGGVDFSAVDLLEFSLVAVPANQEALRLSAKGFGRSQKMSDLASVAPLAVALYAARQEAVSGRDTHADGSPFISSERAETIKALDSFIEGLPELAARL